MIRQNEDRSSNISPPPVSSTSVEVPNGTNNGESVQIEGAHPIGQSHGQDMNLTASQISTIPIPHTPTERFPLGPVTNQLQYIRHNIIQYLMRHKSSAPFRKPVDPVKLKIPYYHLYIQNPMDLSTIDARLNNRYYQSTEECLEDFQLLFSNCYTYNNTETSIVKQARELELALIRRVSDMPLVEEQVQESHHSKLSTGSTGDADDINVSSSLKIASTESGPEFVRRSLRLRQVKTKQQEMMVAGTKQTVINICSSSESDSANEEEGCEPDEKTSVNEVGPKDQTHETQTTTISYRLSEIELVLQQRRKKQMKLIQNQMDSLQKQLEALQEEEKEFSRLFKNFNQPSTSTGFPLASTEKKKKHGLSAPKTDKRPTAIRSSKISDTLTVTPSQSYQTKRKASIIESEHVSSGNVLGTGEVKQRRLENQSTTKYAGSSMPAASSFSVSVSSCMPHASSCMPPASSCMPPASSCMPPASSCMPPASSCMTPASSGMPPASSGMPPASSCMPPASSGTPTIISPVENPPRTPLFPCPNKSKSLDNEQLEKLTTAINKLQSDDFDKIVEIATIYSGIEDEDDGDGMVNLGLLPTAIQWEVVEMVEKSVISRGMFTELNSPGNNTPVFAIAEEFHTDSTNVHAPAVSQTPIMPQASSSDEKDVPKDGQTAQTVSLSACAMANDVAISLHHTDKAESLSVVPGLPNDNTTELNIHCSDYDDEENNEQDELDVILDIY